MLTNVNKVEYGGDGKCRLVEWYLAVVLSVSANVCQSLFYFSMEIAKKKNVEITEKPSVFRICLFRSLVNVLCEIWDDDDDDAFYLCI